METKEELIEKANKSLMKKTKAELVDIILRKDAVERKLREELRIREFEHVTDNANYEDLGAKYNAKCDDYSRLNNDYEEVCDELADIEYACHRKLKHLNRLHIMAEFILFILLLICMV